MINLTDICRNKLSMPFTAYHQGQWRDYIAAAAPNLHTDIWFLLQKVYFVSQQRIHQGERVITRFIHLGMAGHQAYWRDSTARRGNLPYKIL